MSIQYVVSAKDYINDSNVLIISRDMLSRCIDKLVDRGFGVAIIVRNFTIVDLIENIF